MPVLEQPSCALLRATGAGAVWQQVYEELRVKMCVPKGHTSAQPSCSFLHPTAPVCYELDLGVSVVAAPRVVRRRELLRVEDCVGAAASLCVRARARRVRADTGVP